MDTVAALIQRYRKGVGATLAPLVASHYPALRDTPNNEYRKMLELSTKMTLVGHAATESLGFEFAARRRTIATLYGACCFLGDSFLDDFGEDAALEYLDRFELLLTKGWFEVRTEREQLFYIIIARLFAERDVLWPNLRQAILLLHEAQKRDVLLRRRSGRPRARRQALEQLRLCARDRSGHAMTVLTSFLIRDIPLVYRDLIFAAGALIMHIDDHGDCYADRRDRRLTYMNQLVHPERALGRIFCASIERLSEGLPRNTGRELLITFLIRYYVTRLEKHREQKRLGGSAWAVYE